MTSPSSRPTTAWASQWLLWVASWLVPQRVRPEWRAEWNAELWHVARWKQFADSGQIAFALGAFKDAITVRQLEELDSVTAQRVALLDGPLSSLFTLTMVAGMLASLGAWRYDWAFKIPTVAEIWPHVLMAVVSFIAAFTLNPQVESLGTSWERGPLAFGRIWWWLFLLTKTMVGIAIAAFGTEVILVPLTSGTLHAHAFLLPYFFASRWGCSDQTRRCLVCLHRVSSPAQIGTRRGQILDWCGLEYLCRRGHGFLYEPALDSLLGSKLWLPLDSSWSDQFENPKRNRNRQA